MEDVYYAMPCGEGQTTSGQFGQYRAVFTANRDYHQNGAIHEAPAADPLLKTRRLLHEARGLLNEAGIIVGDDTSLEISHHYGIDHFRETGTILINVVNRSYCKKLAILLPGQSHPSHRHHKKEETFQILWGEMELVANDKTHFMQIGDVHLVEPGVWHSFSSRNGCIFEEVSTTHIKNDSEYRDPAIIALDPIQRKTWVEQW